MKLDLDGPNSGSVILTISQANNNWFNETHLPTFYWQGWNDSYSGVNYSGVNYYSVKVNTQNITSSIAHLNETATHSWSMSSSDLSQLNLTCQTHDFTVVAYDKAQTVDSTGSPLQNPTPNSKEKKTTFNYDDCKPNPPELVSSETWYNSGNPNLEIVVGDDTNSFQSGIRFIVHLILQEQITQSVQLPAVIQVQTMPFPFRYRMEFTRESLQHVIGQEIVILATY